MKIAYCGRFAPSPTGPLHFGSLVAAAGSYLDACAAGGRWLVRMEDVDLPRCRPEYDTAILTTLEAYGFEWEGEVMRQSNRTHAYQHLLDRLIAENAAYLCACSRKEIGDAVLAADGAAIYPGTCRHGLSGREGRSWRFHAGEAKVAFHDRVQGPVSQDVGREVGDFVLYRADGYFAYHLAVVADDAEQGITHIVRGADLLDSTPRQICLQQRLGLPVPRYAHLPVAVNAAGEKLSKQTKAPELDNANPVPALIDAFAFLGMTSLKGEDASLADLWNQARRLWSIEDVPRVRTLYYPAEKAHAQRIRQGYPGDT